MPDPTAPADVPDDHAAEDALDEIPRTRRGRRIAGFIALVVLTAMSTVLVVGRTGGHRAGPAPLDLSTISENIAGHYRYAAAHAEAYREIPCWCGCQQYLGHGNLEDCFVRRDGRGWEAHAAGCGVCNGEAAIAARPHAHAAARLRRQHRLSWAFAALAVAGTAAITATLAGGGSTTTADDGVHAGHHPTSATPAGYQLTGETSPMGAPVLAPPGTRSGTAQAGGVTVEGADIRMGHIPLAYGVNPTWQLVNVGDRPVTLGKPQLDIVKGCCPGQIALGSTTLAPGARTTLQFPLQMDPGMDGDHLFRIAVPVDGSSTPLVLSVAGDFS